MGQAWDDNIKHPVEVHCPWMPPLRWPEIKSVAYWYTGTLDDEGDDFNIDNLFMLFTDNRYGLSIEADEDGAIRLRFDGESGDVHGIEIDDFEHCFLRKHPELADGWAALKPEGKNGFHNTP